jgi:hypothetical protein
MFLEAQGLYNSPIVMHQAKKVISYWSGMASGLQENVQEQSKSDFFSLRTKSTRATSRLSTAQQNL